MKQLSVFIFCVLAACSHSGPSPESDWEGFLSQVESGDKAALDKAAAIRPEVDASKAMGLRFAVARALPKAPHHVLALLEKGFKLSELCTIPFIEPKAAVVAAYTEDATRALNALANTPMEVRAKACLKKILPPPPKDAPSPN